MPFTMPFTMQELRKIKFELRAELKRLTALIQPQFKIQPFAIQPQKRKLMQTMSAFSAPKKRMYVKR